MVVSNSDGKRVFTERFGYSCWSGGIIYILNHIARV
jgi:hypothetical protein